MNDKEFYMNRIAEMVASIGNLKWLEKIYYFVKVFAEDKECKE